MHVHKVAIKNVRAIREVSWSVDNAPGWHVVLGDNGAGKSSFLKSVALALAGPHNAAGLRQSWDDWLRRNEPSGEIELQISWDSHDKFRTQGKRPTKGLLRVPVQFRRDPTSKSGAVELEAGKATPSPSRHVWESERGWFSASYGPFRRFSGGDVRSEKVFNKLPKLARHLSLFDERVALTECLEWLRELKFRSLERDPEGALLEPLRDFLNHSDFLPYGVLLADVTSKAVLFRDSSGFEMPVEELSDGYRSILSMTFELIRQMALAFGPDKVFATDGSRTVAASGVVLIDEIDVHLHPTWQKRIGRWLCEHFPHVQFIVSTHSPLVCQAAEHGSIFRLPRPGSDETGGMLAGEDLKRVLFGNVLDAYGTEAFGQEAAQTRSPAARQMRKRLAQLNNKELVQALDAHETAEQHDLRASLPTVASSL